MPPSPFLVPAVLDALSTSKYGKVTYVIPGEAEAYCALAARSSGNIPIILSNDSDLFLHDLGENAGFAFLSTTELRPVVLECACKGMKLAIFQPRNIAKRLGVELQLLGFQLSKTPSQTLSQAVEAVNRKKYGQDIALSQFLDRYVQPSTTKMQPSTPGLDPRISELVLQLERRENRPIEVYLLPLMEDPSRASAWSISSSQRVFAYSICTLTGAKEDMAAGISECTRKGSNYVMQSIKVMSMTQILAFASKLRKGINIYQRTFSELYNPLIWRIFAISEVYRWHLDAGKSPPSAEMMARALSAEPHMSWEDIHFSAQIQALLYSLRMISQALAYKSAISTGPAPAKELQNSGVCLKDLPFLALLLPSPHELARCAAALDVEGVLHRLANILGTGSNYPSD